jgi:hypothetical protein
MLATLLPPALELMTAFTASEDDPGFFWATMQRVVGESLTGADPGRAVAELVFGQAALAGILLDQLAEHTGTDRVSLLNQIHRTYLTG